MENIVLIFIFLVGAEKSSKKSYVNLLTVIEYGPLHMENIMHIFSFYSNGGKKHH